MAVWVVISVTGDARRTRLSSEARREQLLAIGVEMLQSKRLEDLSIDDIASQAGISRGLLFHYFDSMQDFQISVASRIMRGLVDRLDEAAGDELPPEQRLLTSLAVYIDYIAERPDVYRSVVRGASSHEGMRAMADETREQVVDLVLANVAATLSASGRTIDAPAVRIGAHAWIAMTEELVARWLTDAVIDRDELITRIVAPLPGLLGLADVIAPVGSQQ